MKLNQFILLFDGMVVSVIMVRQILLDTLYTDDLTIFLNLALVKYDVKNTPIYEKYKE
jgi:hypothetical protein